MHLIFTTTWNTTMCVKWFSPGDVLLMNLSITSCKSIPRRKKLPLLLIRDTMLKDHGYEFTGQASGFFQKICFYHPSMHEEGRVSPSKACSSAGGPLTMLLPYCLLFLLFTSTRRKVPPSNRCKQNHSSCSCPCLLTHVLFPFFLWTGPCWRHLVLEGIGSY